MKTRLILAASVALAFAVPAFAQDNPPASQAGDQAAPADASQQTDSDAQQPAKTPHRHHRRHYNSANMALTGDDAKTAAYQNSDRQKTYPAVDHGHVPGDPPVIDHSSDQATVANPTATTITVPPNR